MNFAIMDTSVEATALKSDSDGSMHLITAVSSSAEERRSSDTESTLTDVKLPENGEVISENISDSLLMDGNKDSNFYPKSNIPGMSLVMCENNPAKPLEDNITADHYDVYREDSHVYLDQIRGKSVDTAGANDDDGEITDSRSQTPLQDEVEPEVAELNHNQMSGILDTKLDPSMVLNQTDDYSLKTKSECTAASQKSGEENGEVSDDADDEGMTDSKGHVISANQQLPVDAKPVEEEKLTKESEIQKVCSGSVQQQSCFYTSTHTYCEWRYSIFQQKVSFSFFFRHRIFDVA